MKITIITIGTRGDVEPLVALGEGLKLSGHTVKIATHAMFESLIKEHGLEFSLISGNVHEVINSEEVQKSLEKKNNTFTFFKRLGDAAAPLVLQALKESVEASKGADHLICTPITLHMTYFISRELSIPLTVAAVNPAGPTRYFHNLIFPPAPAWFPDFAKSTYNVASHLLVGKLVWAVQRPIIKSAYKEVFGIRLPLADPLTTAFGKSPPLLLYGYSPQILPKPADWASVQHVTGYWFLKQKEEWQAPQELENFIQSGSKPIYIGFGSMNNSRHKQGALKNLILETVKRTGQRAIILNHGFDLNKNELPENIFACEPVPFTWLFPKMAAVIHHGGAGTTAAGLQAGVPSIITPLIRDQKFWAWRVEQVGAGPKPIPFSDLSVQNLSAAINTALSDTSMQVKASVLGKKIREENGVETAVNIFNSTVKNL